MNPEDIQGIYPLSPVQQGILFHSLKGPGEGLYVGQTNCLLHGELDEEAYLLAWERVLARHEILRAAYVWDDLEDPVQVVHRSVGVPLDVLDWREVQEAALEKDLESLLQKDLRRSFELHEAPLMRLYLIRVEDLCYRFIWSSHHLLMDGWAKSLVLQEVLGLYEAFHHGEAPRLSTPTPFWNYLRFLQGQDVGAAEVFWREVLTEVRSSTQLAVEGEGLRKGLPEERTSRLSEDSTAALSQLARRRQMTLSTVVQAAWALLLSRYSGDRRVVFGLVLSGRPEALPGVETIVGCFINTLPFVAEVSPRASVASFLDCLHGHQGEVLRHQHTPLVEVHGWSGVPRGQALFESILAFQNYPVDESVRNWKGSLKITEVETTGITNYPLTVDAVPGRRLGLVIWHDPSRFDTTTTLRMVGHFQCLLEGFAEDPEAPLNGVSHLTKTELHQVEVEWNDRRRQVPFERSYLELFDEVARAWPDSVAALHGDEVLSYSQLQGRSRSLGVWLRQRGVQAGDRVVLLGDRNLEFLAGILGILRVGATYVPVDPALPVQRQLAILELSTSLHVLFGEGHGEDLFAALKAPTGVTTLSLKEGLAASPDDETPLPSLAPESVAYIIFTSGSTGVPKGVMVHQRGMVNQLYCKFEDLDLKRDAVLVQSASQGFDISVFQFLGALMIGGRVLILPKEDVGDPLRLIGKIEQHGVTHLEIVPSLLRLVLEETESRGDKKPALKSLKRLMATGEALPPELSRRWLASYPQVPLVNAYGPAECSDDVSYETIRQPDPRGRTHSLVGRPIGNLRIHLLDSLGRSQAAGGEGEIYIGGVGVGPGYVRRPGLTAEAFLPDPFDSEAGARLYKSGDLGRLLPDGVLQCLGRVDHQVKVRGFRMELGEIEAVLEEHPALRASAVTVHGAESGDPYLVGYVVPLQPPAPLWEDLQSFLRRSLPDYMVPRAWVELDSLPLNANGKVDRNALEAPEGGASSEGTALPPRTPTEELLAEIWATVLRRDLVGVEDDFFAIGGHSLIAARLVSRVREAFQIDLPLRALFDAPTVARMARVVETERRRGEGRPAEPPLESVSREEPLPLSFAQQRLWFIESFEDETSAYAIPAAVRLTGGLDARALEASFQEIIHRHEMLRTTFAEVGGDPVQVIHRPQPVPLPVVDLSNLGTALSEAESRELGQRQARLPFDLSRGPLLRTVLLRLGQREHVVAACMHHIVSDGWSVDLFVRELLTLYLAFSAGDPSPLPPLPVQYADFAVWQRRWLTGDVLETQLDYWRKALADLPPLDLPLDRPRPPFQTFRGATVAGSFVELDRIKDLARETGSTLFMTLLASFQVLLQRFSGQRRVGVGTPIANRARRETEGLIGFFVNTLVLASEVRAEESFRSLLEQVREKALDAYAHQDVPFEKLVEDLHPRRDPSRQALFQVMFLVQNPAIELPKLPDLKLTAEEDSTGVAKFDLMLITEETQEGLACWLNYNVDLFDGATAQRMVGHWTRLLEAALDDPDQALSQLPSSSEAERHQLLTEWHGAELLGSTDGTTSAHGFFEARVPLHPDRLAVAWEEEGLTYGELNARAESLARHLRERGVGPEVPIGISLPRDLTLPIAVLAVLKTGAAFVPLDPAYPQERLELMISDAGMPWVITTKEVAATLPTDKADLLLLDNLTALHRSSDRPQLESPFTSARSENLSHVIYTSGSTGRPKGVAIRHGSVAALLRWGREAYSDQELEGVLASTSLNFDLSVFELLLPLSWGGYLVMAKNALALPTLPAKSKVRLINSVPSAMGELIRQGAVPESVRTVNLAGEPLNPALAEAIHGLGHVKRLCNLYGPSEDTTYSTGAERRGLGTPPIGRPLPGTRAFVLDRHHRPQPLGVPGELCLGGAGLARGYLGRPGLTAERFVPDGASGQPGERLYRTGDLVRLEGEGDLTYLGRLDHQVKVRGHRVELGEIEAVLEDQEGVDEVVVVVSADATGTHGLLAYVAGPELPPLEQLRSVLSKRLPAFMIPSVLLPLKALPRTPNGKVDRQRLPKLDEAVGSLGYQSPRTSTEQLVAEVYASLLGLEVVGAEADFFELGGHSLLATRLISRLRDIFQVELPLQDLFQASSVARVATTVDRLGKGSAVPPIVQISREQPLPLSFAQLRLWFIDQLDPGSSAYNLPSAIGLSGSLDLRALEAALGKIVERHEVLRTTFELGSEGPVQIISAPRNHDLPMLDLSALGEASAEDEASRLSYREGDTGFDLARGPLLRCRVLRFGPERHRLLATLHHIAGDGWSVGIFIEELSVLYRSGLATEGPATSHGSPLNPLPIQYADFSVWQRGWLEGEVLQQQLDYWRDHLGASPPRMDLPLDRPRPALQSFSGGTAYRLLPADLLTKLRSLGREKGATLFMVLLTAYDGLLSRLTGQKEVVVGSPIANRGHSQLEGLIGFFVNTLVLRSSLADDPSFLGLLQRVRAATLGGYQHQDLPFERLVEELQPERDASRESLFQVVLALQNAPRRTLSLPGLEVEPAEVPITVSKFDLTLFAAELPEGLELTLNYKTALFDPTTVARWLEAFEVLLRGAIRCPERAVSDLPWLTEPQRHQVQAEWNDTTTAYPREETVHDVFFSQVRKRPDDVALVELGGLDGPREISYGELGDQVIKLSIRLRALGVGPESRVGVSLARGAEQIVAILAVLQAGGAFVPFDATYPRRRLEMMMEDSDVEAVITRTDVPELPGQGVPKLFLDALVETRGEGSWLPEGSASVATNLAYVMFTSGSTGRPKGVAVSHRSILRLVQGSSLGHFGPSRVFLQLAPVSFDASTLEIWGPLLNGGRLVIMPPGAPTLDELGRAIEEEGITTLWLTAGLFQQMVEDQLPRLAEVEELFAGGDVLSVPHVRQVMEAHGGRCQVINGYGPTENTTFSTTHRVGKEVKGASSVLVGRPISNSQVWILDRRLRPSPPGVPGSLFVGGDGLARGYLGRPRLSALSFIPNPLSDSPGERLYATGDLCRSRPDGSLDFLGRGDRQVKVRGFRIELGEIESILMDHPQLEQAIVGVEESSAGGKALTAFLVGTESKEARELSSLRAFLRERLPSHMVPARMVFLPEFPLNPNGKVDRSALPSLANRQAVDSEGRVDEPPSELATAEEKVLTEIWQTLLEKPRVGLEDDFFELGGHSLLATRVISQVRDSFGVEIPLAEIFEAPTVKGLAARIVQAAGIAGEKRVSGVPPIVAVSREESLPLSFAQQRLWFLDRLQPGNSAYNVPAALRLEGPLVVFALNAALDSLVRRHETLRTTFGESENGPVQVVAESTGTPLPVVDLSG